MSKSTTAPLTSASLGKRLLAIFYDMLIVFFLSFIITLLIQSIIIELKLVTLTAVQISTTETITTIPAESITNTLLKSLWLIIPFLYFGYYWTKTGQTLGMKVWKIKAVSNNNSNNSNNSDNNITWLQAGLRYIGALGGLGFLWMIIDPDHRPLQDRLSQSQLIIQK